MTEIDVFSDIQSLLQQKAEELGKYNFKLMV